MKLSKTDKEIDHVEGHCRSSGPPGCLGSVDCVHTGWDMCPASHQSDCIGKEGFPTLAFEVVTFHTRKILGVTESSLALGMTKPHQNSMRLCKNCTTRNPTRVILGDTLMKMVFPIRRGGCTLFAMVATTSGHVSCLPSSIKLMGQMKRVGLITWRASARMSNACLASSNKGLPCHGTGCDCTMNTTCFATGMAVMIGKTLKNRPASLRSPFVPHLNECQCVMDMPHFPSQPIQCRH